ncbi:MULTISPECIES: hypothetical protein [unclassified Endozoicomonas]|uniref:hypothetical protein n=1 Tax=unclassified Endozoicomonas TaxID=2644528 RepID=UPI003BB5DF02
MAGKMERKMLHSLAFDLVRMEGVSRSVKSGNREPWLREWVVFCPDGQPVPAAMASAAVANKAIEQMMATQP